MLGGISNRPLNLRPADKRTGTRRVRLRFDLDTTGSAGDVVEVSVQMAEKFIFNGLAEAVAEGKRSAK